MREREWAEEEFGSAELGDVRRTARLVDIATAVADKPHAIVLKAIEASAAREGTYRFLRNPHYESDELDRARGVACVGRTADVEGDVIIAVDQVTFTLPDYTGQRGFGTVANRGSEARGVHAMTALALDGSGVPLGILGQVYWSRSEEPGPSRVRGDKKERDHRPREIRESRYWAQILERTCERLSECESNVRPWLQCDRGADYWRCFDIARQHDVLITVRVHINRRIALDDGSRSYLMKWLDALPTKGTYEVEIPAREHRRARVAKVSVSFDRVRVSLGPTRKRRELVPIYYVYVREKRPPKGVKPLSWKLATTYPVKSMDDALKVIQYYRYRWRIEELHRTVKSGTCDLERSQLESLETFSRWAIIHTSVAARAERVKLLSRSEPDAPATVEFTRAEIDTMILLRHRLMPRKKPPYRPGDTPTMAEMTFYIADMGGYAGPRTHPKPGSVPITRGLERLEISVQALESAGYFDVLKL